MVNIEIPQLNNHVSESISHTPKLTINHEAVADLDSSNAFEGPEKLLEVWFSPSSEVLQNCSQPNGLKAVGEDVWKEMLDLVNCKILSHIDHPDVDAYLLSESSMFVWPHKLILKTCGTTTLLYGLPRILEIAALYGGFAQSTAPEAHGISVAASPYRVFYSRKNFLMPDRQIGPHRSWNDEVKNLESLFVGGSAYMIGKMNGEHWYLYVTEPYTTLSAPATPQSMNGSPITETKVMSFPSTIMHDRASKVIEGEDETLEILMTDLDEENAKQFYLENASAVAQDQWAGSQAGSEDAFDVFDNSSEDSISSTKHCPVELTTEGHALGKFVSDHCGLSNIYPPGKYPDAKIDAYEFTPCGFSANAIIPAPPGEKGTGYFTVHVTPEPVCSYASFETNVPAGQTGRQTVDIIQNVVDIFKPGRFTLTLFEAKTSYAELMDGDDEALDKIKTMERSAALREQKMDKIPGYRRVDHMSKKLDGYDLVFRYYERNDWKGGAPRIGERPF